MPPSKSSSEGTRLRHRAVGRNIRSSQPGFVNPYAHMSSIEAMVHLELERRNVPFSWRYFDGVSLHLKTLLPEFSPEFTLKEYKLVILIIGNFFGSLPGILDTNALAQTLLEEDGWRVVTLFEQDIRRDVKGLIDREAPELIAPTFVGKPRPNPYGIPDFMARRRFWLKGSGLLRAKFKTDAGKAKSGRRRIRKRARADSGRVRKQSASRTSHP